MGDKSWDLRGPDEFSVLFPQFERIATVSEITEAMFLNGRVYSLIGYVGDGAAFELKRGQLVMFLTDFANDPAAREPVRASEELKRDQTFQVDGSVANLEERANSSNGVVRFNLSEIPTSRESYEVGCVTVSTAVLAEGRKAFVAQYGDKVTALFDAVHGLKIYGANGIGDLLKASGSLDMRIKIPNVDYLRDDLNRHQAKMVARVPCVEYIHPHFDVDLANRYPGIKRIAIGVLNGAARDEEQPSAGEEKSGGRVMTYAEALKVVERDAVRGTQAYEFLKSVVKIAYSANGGIFEGASSPKPLR